MTIFNTYVSHDQGGKSPSWSLEEEVDGLVQGRIGTGLVLMLGIRQGSGWGILQVYDMCR